MPCSRGCCDTLAEHYRSVAFNTSVEARRIEQKERQWSRDGAAYRRLRRNGLQPHRVAGSAALEAKAGEAIEVEMGRVATNDAERAGIRTGMELSAELGLTA